MTWTKLDDHFLDHPKILAAGERAELLHIHGLIYANKHLTDGFVPDSALKLLLHNPQRGPVDRLVELGIWEVADGGYLIHDFLDWNPSRDKVLTERKRNAERVAKSRGSNAITNGVSHTGSNTAPSRTRPVPEPFNASSVGSLRTNQPALDLAVAIADVLNVPVLAPLEIQACEEALVQFPYLIPSELVERAKEHQNACREKGFPLARNVQGLWEAWRSQNDYNADHGRVKPRGQAVGVMTKAFS